VVLVAAATGLSGLPFRLILCVVAHLEGARLLVHPVRFGLGGSLLPLAPGCIRFTVGLLLDSIAFLIEATLLLLTLLLDLVFDLVPLLANAISRVFPVALGESISGTQCHDDENAEGDRKSIEMADEFLSFSDVRWANRVRFIIAAGGCPGSERIVAVSVMGVSLGTNERS